VGSETVFRGVGSLPGGGGDDWAGLAGRRWAKAAVGKMVRCGHPGVVGE
jgi:hypothetical protein